MSKYKKLVGNSFIFAVGNLGSKLISFVLVPLYTYYLTTKEYGQVDLVTTTVSLMIPIVSGGISVAVLRFALDKEVDKKSVVTNATVIALIGILLTAVCYPLLAATKAFDKILLAFLFLLVRLPNILLENSPGIKRFINDLQLMYQRTFSLNQSAQLFILLTIQRFRVFSDHVVDSFTEVHVPSCLQHAFEKIYTSETPLFKEDFGKETSYIFLFLSLNEYIDSPIVFPDKLTMLDEFIDHMNSVIPFFEKRITVETKEKLKLICYRWDRLYFSVAAFIPAKQSSFFEERFPQIHLALDGFIQKTESLYQKRFLMYERVHLYYDFMFCLLNDRSFCAIEKTIHVFVDFSGGEDYNRFIAKIIASFNYMDVMIDHKLTLETDLYLSDFYSSKVRCRQLTWRHLPETKDWQVFAEVVRELRKGETQKNEHYERDPIEMWREQEYEG